MQSAHEFLPAGGCTGCAAHCPGVFPITSTATATTELDWVADIVTHLRVCRRVAR